MQRLGARAPLAMTHPPYGQCSGTATDPPLTLSFLVCILRPGWCKNQILKLRLGKLPRLRVGKIWVLNLGLSDLMFVLQLQCQYPQGLSAMGECAAWSWAGAIGCTPTDTASGCHPGSALLCWRWSFRKAQACRTED